MYFFLDLSKAFDCVDHKIQLKIMFYYEVIEVPIKQLAAYLDNRVQCTKKADITSFLHAT